MPEVENIAAAAVAAVAAAAAADAERGAGSNSIAKGWPMHVRA